MAAATVSKETIAPGLTVRTVLFEVLVPLPACGIIPYFMTGHWQLQPAFFGIEALRWVGAAIIPIGFVLHLFAVAHLYRRGCAPVPPVATIVSDGVYAWTRNPMYVGALMVMVGEALLFGAHSLLIYAAVWWCLFHLFEVSFDEGVLRKRFGALYTDYCDATPRWIPRPPRA